MSNAWLAVTLHNVTDHSDYIDDVPVNLRFTPNDVAVACLHDVAENISIVLGVLLLKWVIIVCAGRVDTTQAPTTNGTTEGKCLTIPMNTRASFVIPSQ